MQKSCKQCGTSFEITDADLAFYEAVSPVFAGRKELLPPPELCPDCRYQVRLTWRNERSLHRRTCSATGKPIVSIFSADKAWPPVYEQSYWWSDKWDPTSYGRAFDFSRPFFEQFAELFRAVPQIAMNNQISENCEYTNQSQRNKDCYMIFCSNDSRDSYYGMWYQKCEDSIDSSYLEQSRLCREVLNGRNCHSCAYSQNLENCSDVYFSRNCTGCTECFGCMNLRNKHYCWFNEQLEKEAYEKRLADARLDRASSVEAAEEKSRAFFRDFPRKYYTGAAIEASSGDYLMNVKETVSCFNCRNTEAMRHCQDAWRAHHCQDLTETAETEFCYSLEGSVTNVNALFCKKSCDLSHSLYSSHCNFSKHLFGCIAMNHKQFCILNKQYTEDEYNALAPKILAHMRTAGEWGRHFPPAFSPYGYNETVAQEYFPLSREEAVAKGFRWRDAEAEQQTVSKIIPASSLPDSIDDIPDDVLQWGIRCAASNRPFRIIKQELDLYRTLRLPLPRLHPDERYYRRMRLRNPRQLWDRQCTNCKKPIQTTYAPERPEIVYCEECYLKEVY